MNGKLAYPRRFSTFPWRMFLTLAGYRIPMPVTQLKVFPDCRGRPAYYVCPRCKLTMERELMNFCSRCGQRLDWRGCRYAKIICVQAHMGSGI